MVSTTSSCIEVEEQDDDDDDKIIIAIGQDLFSIQEYVTEQYNYTLHQYINRTKNTNTNIKNNSNNHNNNSRGDGMKHSIVRSTEGNIVVVGVGDDVPSYKSSIPSVMMFYTDIQLLRGLDTPIDYGSGIEYMNGLIDLYTPYGIQIGLWLNGTIGCFDIIQHKLDDNIHRLFTYIEQQQKQTKLQKVYLRIGYEFDNPSFGYSANPTLYKNAFQYIVDYYYTNFNHNQSSTSSTVSSNKCNSTKKSLSCNNNSKLIDFVWHSWAQGVPYNTTFIDYYPGNNYVDWIGISIFSQVYTNTKKASGTIQNIQDVIQFAQSVVSNNDQNNDTNNTNSYNSIPIMIAESTPFGGIPNIIDPWENWFIPVLQLITNSSNNIKLWSYINCNWDSQPMWNNVGFGDTRISTNTTIQHLWNTQIVQQNSKQQQQQQQFIFQHTTTDTTIHPPPPPPTTSDGKDDTSTSTNNKLLSSTSLLPLLSTISSGQLQPQQQKQDQHEENRSGDSYNTETTNSITIIIIILSIIVIIVSIVQRLTRKGHAVKTTLQFIQQQPNSKWMKSIGYGDNDNNNNNKSIDETTKLISTQ